MTETAIPEEHEQIAIIIPFEHWLATRNNDAALARWARSLYLQMKQQQARAAESAKEKAVPE